MTTTARFSPDGRHVLTFSGEGAEAGKANVIALWEATTGRPVPLTLPAAPEANGYQAGFSKDGRRLLTYSFSYGGPAAAPPTVSEVWVWETATGQQVSKIRCEGDCNLAVFSPDGLRVLTGHGNGTARIWDAATGAACTPTLKHAEKGSVQVGFSPDGRRALTFNGVGGWPDADAVAAEVRLWDAASGQPIGPAFKPAGNVLPSAFTDEGMLLNVVFSPDGRRVLTALGGGTAQVWEAETGRPVTPPLKTTGTTGIGSSPVSFSPDGRRVVTAGGEFRRSGQARVWDTETGQAVTPALHHEDQVAHVEFSPDGRHVLTASMDGTARVWDAATGEPRTPPLKHAGAVWRASFSSDGRRVYTIGKRGGWPFDNSPEHEARVWDAATGQLLTPPLRSDQAVAYWGASEEGPSWFSPEGRRVLLVRADGTVEVYDLAGDPRPVDELLAQTQVLSGRRVNAAGSVMPLEADRFRSGWQSLRARSPVELARPDPDVHAWHRQEAEACMARREPFSLSAEPKDVSAAVRHLDRLLQADPAGVRARTLRGRAHAALGRWGEAVADYSQAIAPGTDEAPWYDRGVAHVQLGKWDQAADDFARATQVANAPPHAWSALALVRLHLRDAPGYRGACGGFFERHGKSSLWLFRGLSVARTCTVGPDALKDFQPLVQLVEKPSQGWYAFPASGTTVKAAVYYRAGRHPEAVRLLTETVTGKVAVAAQDYFFLALAQHQLGHPNEARQALARGVERFQQLHQERSKDSPAAVLRSWQEQLEEQLLRREAEQLLQGKAVEPKD